MKIAVLSGKGGTGKTFVSTNLTSVIEKSTYLDCDVEEPNGYLFFNPKDVVSEDVEKDVPNVIQDMCTGCKKCVETCKFNALAYGSKLLIFNELCHSCTACMYVCPERALGVKKHNLGVIESGHYKDKKIVTGKLNIGEASGTKIIKEMISKYIKDDTDTIIDCPPGSACSVMDSIRDADYALIVVEPTIFGLENFKIVYDLVKHFNKPFGVVINKYEKDNNITEKLLEYEDMNILLKIPFDKEVVINQVEGQIISDVDEVYREMFVGLHKDIKEVLI